jgi:hypothetical protein
MFGRLCSCPRGDESRPGPTWRSGAAGQRPPLIGGPKPGANYVQRKMETAAGAGRKRRAHFLIKLDLVSCAPHLELPHRRQWVVAARLFRSR